MSFSAELGSLLVILTFVCFEEPYRWKITVAAKDVGFSKLGLQIVQCLGRQKLWTRPSQTIDICANSFDLFMHQ